MQDNTFSIVQESSAFFHVHDQARFLAPPMSIEIKLAIVGNQSNIY